VLDLLGGWRRKDSRGADARVKVEGTFDEEEVNRSRRKARRSRGKENENEATSSQVTWESVKWRDGSNYEGLVREGKCHIRGVLRYANGDRYEGEYKDNHMNGLGVYVWKNGAVYRGEWSENNMHGCGVKLIPKGNGEIVPQEGEWLEDSYIGDVMTCSKYLSRKKAMEADHAARGAREFKVKPQPRARRG